MSTDRLEELRRICDTYGADPAHWPAVERDAYAALFLSDEAAEIRAEAQALDGFLNAATAPRMAEDLTRRITAAYVPPAQQSLSVMDWFRSLAPFAGFKGMRLVPAGALAGLGAIGLASGIMTASAEQPLTPESEALAYFETDIVLASLDEEEAATWDAD
jgi:hypothetical protein